MTTAAAEGGLGFDEEKSAAIYGLYTAGVYLLALPGGWIADRLIGTRKVHMARWNYYHVGTLYPGYTFDWNILFRAHFNRCGDWFIET